MLDVDDKYGTPDTPLRLPTFKDFVAQDVQTVFFNLRNATSTGKKWPVLPSTPA